LTLQEIYDARGKVIKEQKELNDLVQARDGVFTPEEQEKWDKADVDFNGFTDSIKRAEALRLKEEEAEKRAEQHVERDLSSDETDRGGTGRDSMEYRKALQRYYISGDPTELRAVQADLDIVGGYFTVSEQMESGIVQAVDNLLFIKQAATVIRVPAAQSATVLRFDTDVAAPTDQGEISSVAEETSARFGKVGLTPHLQAEFIYIAEQLLRQSVIDMEGFLRERFIYQFANDWEAQYMTGGGGALSCLGLFVDSNDGIPSGRDYSTGNAVDGIVADNLVGNFYNLKPQYRNSPNCRWIFSRGGVRRIR
jgi:HK97 family phage major capsid protein